VIDDPDSGYTYKYYATRNRDTGVGGSVSDISQYIGAMMDTRGHSTNHLIQLRMQGRRALLKLEQHG